MAQKFEYTSAEKALIKEVSKGKRKVSIVAIVMFLTMCTSLVVTSFAIFSGTIPVDNENFGYNVFAPFLTYGLLFVFTILGVVFSFQIMRAMIKGKPFSQLSFFIFQIVYFFYFMIYMFNFYPNDETKFVAIFYLIFFIITISTLFLIKGNEQNKFFENMKIIYSRNRDEDEIHDENDDI